MNPRLLFQQAQPGSAGSPSLFSPPARTWFADDPRLAGIVTAARLQRPVTPTVPSGTAEVDALTGGLPRGALTEICGPASSGRSSVLLAALAEATRRQEICALVDTSDSFDPHSAVAAGIALERLLWIRCSGTKSSKAPSSAQNQGGRAGCPKTQNGMVQRYVTSTSGERRSYWLQRIAQALKATDLLLQGGGLGLVAVDLADVPPEFARRVPVVSWFRFRRVVEQTPTVLLIVEQEPYAQTCASLVLKTAAGNMSSALSPSVPEAGFTPAHGQLFQGIRVHVEIMRSRLTMKKSAGNVKFSREARVVS